MNNEKEATNDVFKVRGSMRTREEEIILNAVPMIWLLTMGNNYQCLTDHLSGIRVTCIGVIVQAAQLILFGVFINNKLSFLFFFYFLTIFKLFPIISFS